jgi:hypothetical protein
MEKLKPKTHYTSYPANPIRATCMYYDGMGLFPSTNFVEPGRVKHHSVQ